MSTKSPKRHERRLACWLSLSNRLLQCLVTAVDLGNCQRRSQKENLWRSIKSTLSAGSYLLLSSKLLTESPAKRARPREPGLESPAMGSHGDPWGPMGTHGNPWEPMIPHGGPWVPMGPHGDPWSTTETFPFFRFEYPWIFHGFAIELSIVFPLLFHSISHGFSMGRFS